jgi:hypothetical protein
LSCPILLFPSPLLELRVIDAISRTFIDTQLRHAVPEIPVIAEVPVSLDSRDPSLDSHLGSSISNSIKPAIKRVPPIGREVMLDLHGL